MIHGKPASVALSLIIVIGLGVSNGAAATEKKGCGWSILTAVGQLLGLVGPKGKETKKPGLPEVKETPPALVQGSTEIEERADTKPKKLMEPVTAPKSTGDRWASEAASKKKEKADAALAALQEGGRPGELWRDFLGFELVRRIARNRNTIGLLYGSADAKLSVKSPSATKEYMELLATLVEKKCFVFYDADSKLAPYIAEQLGELGIGISGSARRIVGDQYKVITIQNPYLRLEAWQAAERLIMNNNSLVGLGLYFSNRGVDQIVSPDSDWTLSLESWGRKAPVDLGLKYHKSPKIGSSLSLGWKEPNQKPWGSVDVADEIKLLETWELNSIEETVAVIIEGERRMSADPATNSLIPGGAAVLGSSRNHPTYTQLVYQTARMMGQRGIPTTTGGSGGYMEVANMGAFDAGAISIGVPMYGVFGEKSVATSVQTMTISSKGYSSRIPLIFHRREIVNFVPGGDGTMRELATALVATGANEDTRANPFFIFTGGDYYGPLLEPLAASFRHDAFLRRVFLVRQADDVPAILDHIDTELAPRISNLRTAVQPAPRNDRTEYPVWTPKYSSSRSSGDDDDWLLD